MHIQFVAKKVDGKTYDGALIVDGKFQRAGANDDLRVLFERLCANVITAAAAGHSDEVTVNISFNKAD